MKEKQAQLAGDGTYPWGEYSWSICNWTNQESKKFKSIKKLKRVKNAQHSKKSQWGLICQFFWLPNMNNVFR